MNTRLGPASLLAAFAVACHAHGASPPLTPQAAQPCLKLAAIACQVPSNAWAAGLKALEPALHIEVGEPTDSRITSAPASPSEIAMTHLPSVVEALGSSNDWTIFVEHIRSTSLYAAYSVQGTAYCQEVVFLAAGSDGVPRKIDGPQTYKGELCLTQSADLGEFKGHPVFITHGTDSQSGLDQDVQITPWTRKGWGASCRVALRFRPAYTLVQRYCGDLVVCRHGEGVAVQVVQAYANYQSAAGAETFIFGAQAPVDLQANVMSLRAESSLIPTPEFPTFWSKAAYTHPWSSTGFTFFPLVLDAQAYIGAIGHEGVGWRQGGDTLFAIYEAKGEPQASLASFIISRSVAALREAVVGLPVIQEEPQLHKAGMNDLSEIKVVTYSIQSASRQFIRDDLRLRSPQERQP